MLVEIYIGTEQLELFEDESISITSSVLDIQDITKNTTDYTKSFTVPASEVNNKIFKHYYDANIDNTFDARVSVDGRIEIGGMPFRLGKFLLQKVSVKSGVPSNYTINFFGNLISLKELLGDDKLADLDLSDYDHPYTSDAVQFLLKSSASSYPSILYNLLAKKRYYYSSDAADDTQEDTISNIHYKSAGDSGVMWDDLRPSIALYQLINAIELDYGLTFSSDFFGLDTFKKLYMWLNNSVEGKAGSSTGVLNFNDGINTYIDFTTNIGTFETSGLTNESGSDWFTLSTFVFPDARYIDSDYTINVYDSGVLVSSVSGAGNQEIANLVNSNSVNGDTVSHSIHWELVVDGAFEYTCECFQSASGSISLLQTLGGDELEAFAYVSLIIPDMKIIDFLKGIFNAFKLVVIPQDDGTIFVDTVTHYYEAGQLLDLTEWIDAESVDVSRGDILNTINYNFKEPQTLLNITFDSNNGIAYGDEEAQLKDDADKLLDGGSSEIELPFEQVIYERLIDINGVDTIELMYGAIIDKELAPANPKAHVFYNQSKRVGGSGIGFINDDGSKDSIKTEINTASHCINDSNPTDSFIFSAEFNNFTGEVLNNNLYSKYHKDYIDSLFNIKRRSFKYNTKTLPVSILLDLTLNDVVKIGYNYYRIDKFTTDLTTGATEFNLINAFGFVLNAFTSDDTYIILSNDAQTHSSYITNLTSYSSNKIDLGDGTSWVTVSNNGKLIEFTVTENLGNYRNVQVDITDNVSGTTISFYIGQNSGSIGADSTTETADDTTHTADNDKDN